MENPSPARLLFVGEAVSLANVGRPLLLARWARAAGYEVHFACGEAYAALARQTRFEPQIVTTVLTENFYRRLNRGRFFYTAGELEVYVQAERALFARLRPDLIVGDFRLSLAVSASLAGIPLLTLNNAHWSPAAAARFPAPRQGWLGRLPPPWRERVFGLLRPLALRYFAAPLNRVRKRYGLRALPNFRELYCAGDGCAYLDLPEFLPLAKPLPNGHFFLGPVVWAPGCASSGGIASGLPACMISARPLAYVSLGSSGEKGVLPEVLGALLAQGCQVALSGVGEAEQVRLRQRVPGWKERWLAADLLDPQEILAQAVLCVCHGGSGTVYQGLGAGLPLLCLPGNPDQGLVSQALSSHGAGLVLDPGEARGRRLAEALEALRQRPSYRTQAQRLAKAIAGHDTRRRWLAFLREFVNARLHQGGRRAPLSATLAEVDQAMVAGASGPA